MTKTPFLALRGELKINGEIMPMDRQYNILHDITHDKYNHVQLVKGLVNKLTPSLIDNHKYLSVDSIYYKEVREFFAAQAKQYPDDFLCYAVFSVYPNRNGHYHYYDEEGAFKIRNGILTNMPRDNGFGYKHPLFEYDPYTMNDMDTGEGLYFKMIEWHPTSANSAIVLCTISYSPSKVSTLTSALQYP